MRRLLERRGQVSLEVLAVAGLWIVVTMVFFNVMFTMSAAMLVQASVNRVAVQSGSMGCFAKNRLQDDLKNHLGWVGNDIVEIKAKRFSLPERSFPGQPMVETPTSSTDLPACVQRDMGVIPDDETYAPSGQLITVSVTYKQFSLLFADQQVTRSATVTSARLDRG